MKAAKIFKAIAFLFCFASAVAWAEAPGGSRIVADQNQKEVKIIRLHAYGGISPAEPGTQRVCPGLGPDLSLGDRICSPDCGIDCRRGRTNPGKDRAFDPARALEGNPGVDRRPAERTMGLEDAPISAKASVRSRSEGRRPPALRQMSMAWVTLVRTASFPSSPSISSILVHPGCAATS